ncbi:hypothetical protein [Methylobacterium sp. Leaf465]|uniref:hypothetical protein n=1 Tax=Methylobacterium sp. Leaf465 TaxID=1736385 RepID=UPI0012E3C18B|nr:hypothetical protein [Methylobacterium sp. Leaf465]
MATEPDENFRMHVASLARDGFELDPTGFERLSPWTHLLMHLLNAKKNFEWVRDHKAELGNIDNVLQQHALFVAAIMAYCRCYATSGPAIPVLDAKKVYKGSDDGKELHRRLINIRNTIAAHTDKSDLTHVTLAAKEDNEKISIRQLSTLKIPTNEIPSFIEAVEHTEHFVTVSLNKQLDFLEKKLGKKIVLD